MQFNCEYHVYQRKFLEPLQTSCTSIRKRNGILLRMRTKKCKDWKYGEVAPMPSHGTESINEALKFLNHTKGIFHKKDIKKIGRYRPCLMTAIQYITCNLNSFFFTPAPIKVSGLLSAGEISISQLEKLKKKATKILNGKLEN